MKEKSIAKPTKPHLLSDIWNAHPDALSNNYNAVTDPPSVEKIIGEMFAMGPFYYYVINMANSTLSNHHPELLKMHGLKRQPQHLKEIINLIHPDDLEFVMQAENMTLQQIKEIGFEHQLNLKSSYCFRMKTAKGNYEMFHHQALHSLKDENGRLLQAVNIHTNIEHITKINSYIVLVTGIGERTDFHQMQYNSKTIQIPQPEINLTKREIEILSLLATGYTAKKIAEYLNISYHTTTTHRKNIFSKLKCTKISELVKRALELGLI